MRTAETDWGGNDVLLAHLDTAYRLARWLARDEPEAEAVVEDAYRRAVRRSGPFSSGNARVRLLRMVIAAGREWRGRRFPFRLTRPSRAARPDPTAALSIEHAIRSLPERLREVLVLRDLEDLTYRELSDVLGISVDTVTLTLSHARRALSAILAESFPVAVRQAPSGRVREA